MKFVLVFILCLTVGACARTGVSKQSPAPPEIIVTPAQEHPPRPAPVNRVGGLEPEAFYDQFLYRLIGECGDSVVIYRFSQSPTFKINVNRNGQDVRAELSLMMLGDHRFFAFYQEMDVILYTSDGFRYKTHRERVIQGTWTVNQTVLVLTNLGFATGGQYDNHPAVQLTMTTDLITAGLKGNGPTLRNVDADYMPVQSLDPCK
jgi:hypothetical protein